MADADEGSKWIQLAHGSLETLKKTELLRHLPGRIKLMSVLEKGAPIGQSGSCREAEF